MFPGGKKHFRGGQRVTLNSEKLAGAGMRRLPGDFEMPAYKTVWRAGGDVFFRASGITFHLRSIISILHISGSKKIQIGK